MQIKKFFKDSYQRLVTIDDSPHKIAGGFAVGVFLGILPGAGPVAAIVTAWVLHLNRAAAFAGGFLTNTWLSVVTLVLAVKIGAGLTGTSAGQLLNDCKELLKHFNWRQLFDEPVLNILKPVMAGYAVIALVAGAVAYAVAFYAVHRRQIKSQ